LRRVGKTSPCEAKQSQHNQNHSDRFVHGDLRGLLGATSIRKISLRLAFSSPSDLRISNREYQVKGQAGKRSGWVHRAGAISLVSLVFSAARRTTAQSVCLQRVFLHAFIGTMNPSDALPASRAFNLPVLYARSLSDSTARQGLSCSAFFFGNVPPPSTPERSSTPSGFPECCLLPSPRHDRLGPFKHLIM
jgi:hypothetical protein